MKKSTFFPLLLLCMALCMLPVFAFAETADEPTSGTCSDGLVWALSEDGVLTISGQGDMADYTARNAAPWRALSSRITSAVIKDGVTAIGNYAFYQCNNLSEISIASSVDTIGSSAFSYTALTAVTLPEGVTTIKSAAFNVCPELKEITIPASMATIGADAFYNCSTLETVHISDLSAWCGIFFELEASNPMSRAQHLCLNGEPITELVIPNDVTVISDYAFANCTELTDVVIPSSVVNIKSHAFFCCTNLRSVEISDSVTAIGNYAFHMCYELREVVLPKNLQTIGNAAFTYNQATELTIPAGVTKVGSGAFSNCKRLVSVKCLTPISNAFASCTNLAVLYLPANVTAIKETDFEYFQNLQHILYGGTQAQWNSIFVGSDSGTVAGATVHYNCSGNEIRMVSDNCSDVVFFCSVCNKNVTATRQEAPHVFKNGACVHCGSSVLATPEMTISTKADSGKPYLYWTPVQNRAKYELYRSATYGGPYTLQYAGSSNAYTDTTVKAGEKFYYKVVALTKEGYPSKASNICTIYCDLPSPKLTITNRTYDGKPTLRWNAVAGAKEYVIYRSTSYAGPYSNYFTTTSTSFTNTTPQPGDKYYYKVRAISSNASANSAFSNISAIVCDLPQPTGVTITTNAATGKPVVSWDAVAGAKEYAIYRSTTYDGTYTKYYTTTSTSFTNSAVQAGQKYYYKVRALSANESANGSLSKAVTIVCDCGKPTITASRNSNGKPVLTWDAVAGATGYEIWRSTTYDGTYSRYYITSATSFTNSAASAGQQYYYKVRAIVSGNSSATGAYSNIVTVTAK